MLAMMLERSFLIKLRLPMAGQRDSAVRRGFRIIIGCILNSARGFYTLAVDVCSQVETVGSPWRLLLHTNIFMRPQRKG